MDFEKNREWANSVNEKLEHSDPSTIVQYFENLEKKWELKKDISTSFNKILKNFNIKSIDDIDINFIETEKNKIIWEILGVQNKFKKLIRYDIKTGNVNGNGNGYGSEDEDEDQDTDQDTNNYKIRWERLIEKIFYSERLLRTHYLLNQTNKPHYSYELNEDTSALFKFIPISYEKNTSFQNLLLFLLE